MGDEEPLTGGRAGGRIDVRDGRTGLRMEVRDGRADSACRTQTARTGGRRLRNGRIRERRRGGGGSGGGAEPRRRPRTERTAADGSDGLRAAVEIRTNSAERPRRADGNSRSTRDGGGEDGGADERMTTRTR